MKDIRLEKLAEVLTEYSTKIKKGDIVCISGEEATIPFIKEVAKKAIKKGGIVKYFVDLPEIDETLFKEGDISQIEQPNYRFGECARADVWISAWGTDNISTLSSADGELLKKRRLANSENRKIYNIRTSTGDLRWCGTQFPTNGDAQYAAMSLEEYEEFVYKAGFLNYDDPVDKWNELSDFHEKWIKYLDTKKSLHIIGKDTNLHVNINGRKWINCCGTENFPDGEIFTSPIEDGLEGYITFSYPAIMNGNMFKDVRLEFSHGKIVSASCDDKTMCDKLMTYIDTDEGSRHVGEIAFGTNYGIRRFTNNILFDEKIGGSMHLAIGAGFPEAGGKNESAIHWDMINDMSVFGEVYADNEIFYRNGSFLDDIL